MTVCKYVCVCRYVCECVYMFVNILKKIKLYKNLKIKNQNFQKIKINHFLDMQHVMSSLNFAC
jgi:hypothetical protein